MAASQLLRRSFTSLIDYFEHPSFREGAERLYRARILIALLLTFSALLALTLIFQRFSGLHVHSHGRSELLSPVMFVGNMVLLLVMRWRGSYKFCCAAAIVLAGAAVFLGLIASGGVRGSPMMQLLVAPLLMAYFFGGMRWGTSALLTICVTVGGLAIAEWRGVSFPQNPGALADRDGLQILACFLGAATVSAIACIFEFTAAKLKKERDTEHGKMVALAQTDALTGLANRRSFDAYLSRQIATRGTYRFALCYLDLDGFKPINDQLGHEIGDEVLRVVSTRLRAAIRASDLVGRPGGDEFMILLESTSTRADLEIMAQRTRESIGKPINTSLGPVKVGVSMGFAVFPDDADAIGALKKAADTAMYIAKHDRTGWSFYDRHSSSAAVVAKGMVPVSLLPDGGGNP